MAGPRPSSGHYTSLLAIAVQKQLERPPDLTLPVPIVTFLLAFNNQCIDMNESQSSEATLLTPTPTAEPLDPPTLHAMQCVLVAATLYWTAVSRDTHERPYDKTSNDGLIQALRTAVVQSDDLFWLRFGPEVLRWVLMTGAAAAASLQDQAWFIMRAYMVTAIIEPAEMDAFLVGADHLLWVFNHCAEAQGCR